jgi:hypothetical protein
MLSTIARSTPVAFLNRLIAPIAIAIAFLAAAGGQTTHADLIVETHLQFDPALSQSSNYLSDVIIFYFYDDRLTNPALLYDPISHNSGNMTIPVNTPFYYASGYSSFQNADAFINYAVIGAYHDIDGGGASSFFSTFSNPSIAAGQSFDAVFGGFDPYLDHSEEDVLEALKDPFGYANIDNALILSYLMSFVIDNPEISALMSTPVQTGQTATLVHFSEGTAFGQSTAGATQTAVVPEPSSLALAAIGLVCAAATLRRKKPARPAHSA